MLGARSPPPRGGDDGVRKDVRPRSVPGVWCGCATCSDTPGPRRVVSHPPRFCTSSVPARLTHPGLLQGVLDVGERPQHPLGHCPEVRSVFLEALCQPLDLRLVLPPADLRHVTDGSGDDDPRTRADVTSGREWRSGGSPVDLSHRAPPRCQPGHRINRRGADLGTLSSSGGEAPRTPGAVGVLLLSPALSAPGPWRWTARRREWQNRCHKRAGRGVVWVCKNSTTLAIRSS